MTAALFTVERPDGTRIVRRFDDDALKTLSPGEFVALGEVYARLLGFVAEAMPHVHVDDRPWVVAGLLVELAHEQDTYERVCARKGLLPL